VSTTGAPFRGTSGDLRSPVTWDLRSGGALAGPPTELVPICKTNDEGVGARVNDKCFVRRRVLVDMMLAKVGCPFRQNK
jgi:hypothetical protein